MIITVELTGYSHDAGLSYPTCQIKINDKIIYANEIVGNKKLTFEVESSDKNLLQIAQIHKLFGEGGQWHTIVKNNEVQDRFLVIEDITFDHVSIKKIWHLGEIHNTFNTLQINSFHPEFSPPPYTEKVQQGYNSIRISYNGSYDLHFECPVYNWIITSMAPAMKISGRLKESSLTSIVNWRIDYTNGNGLEDLYNECIELLEKIE